MLRGRGPKRASPPADLPFALVRPAVPVPHSMRNRQARDSRAQASLTRDGVRAKFARRDLRPSDAYNSNKSAGISCCHQR